MTRVEMRIRPGETGLVKWISSCLWLAMQWAWEMCGDFPTLLSRMEEVREASRNSWLQRLLAGTGSAINCVT